jgi:hypothetical protein
MGQKEPIYGEETGWLEILDAECILVGKPT